MLSPIRTKVGFDQEVNISSPLTIIQATTKEFELGVRPKVGKGYILDG